jgi:hypothetical protein
VNVAFVLKVTGTLPVTRWPSMFLNSNYRRDSGLIVSCEMPASYCTCEATCPPTAAATADSTPPPKRVSRFCTDRQKQQPLTKSKLGASSTPSVR